MGRRGDSIGPARYYDEQEPGYPFFLPIVSADKQQVVGYEVQPYWMEANERIKLNWFFEDRSIPSEYRLELEDDLQKKQLTCTLPKTGKKCFTSIMMSGY